MKYPKSFSMQCNPYFCCLFLLKDYLELFEDGIFRKIIKINFIAIAMLLSLKSLAIRLFSP
jgi:hypothetical protein